MLKTYFFAAAIFAVAAGPALAEECGSPPIGPAIPAASDLNGKAVEAGRAEVLAAYHQVKAYQAALKPYRECLVKQAANDKAEFDADVAKPDKDAAAKVQDRLNDRQKTYDGTVDSETQVATDFNNLHMAQCKVDTDTSICPKK